MSAPFLRGSRVVLTPLEIEDAAAADALPMRLLPPAPSPPDLAIVFAARDVQGGLLGRLALEAVDWPARRARATMRWGEDASLAAEALGLLARYSVDDVNLDALEALPADPAWAAVLQAAGFRAAEGPWTRPRSTS